MTGLDAFLAGLRARGIRLWVEGETLKLRAPEGVLDPGLTEAIRRRKPEILALLRPEPDEAIPPLPAQESHEVSAAQRRLWVLAQFLDAAAAYNIPLHHMLEGQLDRPALQLALDRLVQRHESLRSTFTVVAGEPRQVVHDRLPVPLGFRDLADAERPEELARALGRDHARAPFDLATGPLLRVGLLRLASDRHLLLFTIAHIVADGVSLGVVARDLSRLYQAARSGGPDVLPRLGFGYPAYAAWQNRQLATGAIAAHRAYWHDRLAGDLPILALPTDHPRAALQGFEGGELSFVLPAAQLAALEALCRRHNASLFMLLHALLTVLLHAYTGQEDIIVGCAVSGRERADLADQVGLYLNTLALRSRIRSGMSFAAFLDDVVRDTREAFDHQAYPFDRLVDDLALRRDPSRSPLFDVMLILQNQQEPGLAMGELRARPAFEHPGTSKFDLTFAFKATPGGLVLALEYNSGLFEPASVRAMGASFEALAEAVLADPSRPIQDLPSMTPAQQAALLASGRGPALPLPAADLFGLFEAQARRTPSRRAVMDRETTRSYAEVLGAAELHAAQLQHMGVGPGQHVGLMLERSADLPAALLGILRTGAAYVPLDPGLPAERLAYAATDAGIRVLLTESSLRALWPAGVTACCVDAPAPADPPRAVAIDPAGCAYLLHTSGSTGRPKGVRVSHRAAVNLLLAMQRELGIGEEACLLAVTTIAFDIAVLELFLPLVTGGRVVVCDRATAADGRALAQRIAETGADWLQATPTTWRMLLDAGWPGQRDLNALCGGEPLTAELAAALLPRTAALWNLYGPTETTVWSTCGWVRPGAPIGLGQPIGNTRLFVLDDRQRMVPPGAVGELCIGGEGVAMDYWQRPELTAAAFLSGLACDPEVGRVYRTGDRVRWAGDGRLEYLGRRDHQIKLRGHRVELGEIEAVLAEHPGVRRAAAALRDGERLVAWYDAAGGEAVLPVELRAHLRARLPEYMVPAAFVPVTEFPLTPNGKLDRRALTEPERDLDPGAGHEPPRTDFECRIARLWQDVLRAPRVGAQDDFFALGGHSLKAAAFAARLQAETGVWLDLVDVFRHPTLAALARLAETRLAAAEAARAEPDEAGIRPVTAEELAMLGVP